MSESYRQRRRFLKQALAASLVGSGAGAVNGKLSLIGSALAQSSSVDDDYRALVCVFLYGGSDSFNLYIPGDTARFSAYESARAGLALPRDTLLPAADGSLLMHPRLTRLRDRYDAGELTVVGNVGNLITPLSRSQLNGGSARIPPDLFAHNHQQEQWQKGWSSRPMTLVGPGWGGRMADLLDDVNAGSSLPPLYTLSGGNHFSTGSGTTPVAVDPRYGAREMPYLDVNVSASNTARDAALAEILGLSRRNLMQNLAAQRFGTARRNTALIASVLAANAPSTFDFNTVSDLGPQLRMVARLIAGHQATSQRRQIFFVGMGGWDTHDRQSPRLMELAADLDLALDSFQREIESLDLASSVTTFTASDFGRTLTINGDGSDHGWGGHYLVMGGAVDGGRFVGEWPSYNIGGEDDSGDKGRIIPAISVNEYGAALARWMGLSASEILGLFPDLGNFGSEWQSQLGIFRT